VGRRKDRLTALAASPSSVAVQVVVADLSTDEGIDTVAELCASRPLTMLVNNAGVAHYMPMVGLPADKARQLLHVKGDAERRLGNLAGLTFAEHNMPPECRRGWAVAAGAESRAGGLETARRLRSEPALGAVYEVVDGPVQNDADGDVIWLRVPRQSRGSDVAERRPRMRGSERESGVPQLPNGAQQLAQTRRAAGSLLRRPEQRPGHPCRRGRRQPALTGATSKVQTFIGSTFAQGASMSRVRVEWETH